MNAPVRITQSLAAVLLVGLQLNLALPAASAHTTLVEATPGRGASVAAPPQRVALRFDEPLTAGAEQLTVTGPGDAADVWTAGVPTVTGDRLAADLTGLGDAGVYTVKYRVTSADGHVVTGSTYFALTGSGGGTPAAQPGDETGAGVPVLALGAGVAAVAVAGAALLRRRRRGAAA